MTEAEWLASANPLPMLDYLLTGRPETGDTLEPRPSGIGYRPTGGRLPVVTERKLRLFAVACCYGVSEELGQDAETCVEWNSGPAHDAANWARGWVGDQKKPTLLARAALLREVFGNPWRPVKLPTQKRLIVAENVAGDSDYHGPATATIEECPWLTWNDHLIPKIAQSIYSSEHLWDDMPALADALLDAGADDETLLDHCRNGGPHVRGCWALDLLLGKE